MVDSLVVLAVVALGVTAGALLAEALILVPFWRSSEPSAFLDWYRQYSGLLLRFFGPLEIAALVLPGMASFACWLNEDSRFVFLGISTLLSLLILLSFPIYFKKANASFAAGTIEKRDVAVELTRWARWHWSRTSIAVIAFAFSVVSCL